MEEKDLVRLLKQPETKNEGFRILLHTYKEALYKFTRKIVVDHQDTDEVLQITFIKVFKYIEGFQEKSTLFTWLCTIARREAVNFLAVKSSMLKLSIDDLTCRNMELISVGDAYYTGNEIQLKLQNAVAKLPEKQREVFNMKYFDKLLFKEIAIITGISEGGLKANYHLAVRRLKELLVTA